MLVWFFGDRISSQNPNWTELTYSCLSASLMLELQTCVVMPSSQVISFFRVPDSKTESLSSCLFRLNPFTNMNHLQMKEALHNTTHSMSYSKCTTVDSLNGSLRSTRTLFLCVSSDTIDQYLLSNWKAIWQFLTSDSLVTLQCPLLVPLIVQVAYLASPIT